MGGPAEKTFESLVGLELRPKRLREADKKIGSLPYVAQVRDSLKAAGIDVAIYDEVKVEPTDQSFLAATRFAVEGKFDGYVSVGGGSVIDTCKAANLYATYPADFLDYVNAPIRAGKPIPREYTPHGR